MKKHLLDYDWQQMHAVLHYGHSIVLYLVVGLFSLYIIIRLVFCMKTRGVFQSVTGALGANSPVAAAPD
jgi:hypothetical protein